MPISKGSLWFSTGCACILCLSAGLGFSLLRHRAAEREIAALKQQLSEANTSAFALRVDVGRDLDFLRSQNKRMNQITEELAKVTGTERTGLEQSIAKVEKRMDRMEKDGIETAEKLSTSISLRVLERKEDVKREADAHEQLKREVLHEVTKLRFQLTDELRTHILQPHR